jgi:hypothetical protein
MSSVRVGFRLYFPLVAKHLGHRKQKRASRLQIRNATISFVRKAQRAKVGTKCPRIMGRRSQCYLLIDKYHLLVDKPQGQSLLIAQNFQRLGIRFGAPNIRLPG